MDQKMKTISKKTEGRHLRKKFKRIEESRSKLKNKCKEKSEFIKKHQDRESDLRKSRDSWKNKHKEAEEKNNVLSDEILMLLDQIGITEEELKDMRESCNSFKKNHRRKTL